MTATVQVTVADYSDKTAVQASDDILVEVRVFIRSLQARGLSVCGGTFTLPDGREVSCYELAEELKQAVAEADVAVVDVGQAEPEDYGTSTDTRGYNG